MIFSPATTCAIWVRMHVGLFFATVAVAACGTGGGVGGTAGHGGSTALGGAGGQPAGDASPTTTVTVGGTLSGMGPGKSLVLQNNGANPLTLTANGTYSFSVSINTGYSIAVRTQPTAQTCIVMNGSGTVGTSDVTNIFVTCPSNGAPLMLFTDFISGPISGGESGKGAYLTVTGKNFGDFSDWGSTSHLYIGGCEVDNYRFLQPLLGGTNSKAANVMGLQSLGVQVGSLCGAKANGTALKVDMTVNGVHPSNATDASGNYVSLLTKYDGTADSLTWSVQPGNIYFVDIVKGSDTNDGSFAHPYQHVQSSDGFSGALRKASGDATKDGTPPGTYVVARGGNYNYAGDNNFVANLYRIGGTAPTGASNRGPICITSYPGVAGANSPELASFYPPANASHDTGGGGFLGNDNAHSIIANPYDGSAPYAKWFAWSRIFISSSQYGARDAAPINLDSSCDYCRVINTELTWPWTSNADNTTNAAGIAGNGYHMVIAGNYVHDIGGVVADDQNHGIYLDGSTHSARDVVVAFNTFRNLTAGNGIQTYDSQANETLQKISVHHNWVENANKHGLNQGNMTESAVWHDNIVLYSGESGIRIVGADTTANNNIQVYNNVVYGWDRLGSGARYGYQDDGSTNGKTVDVRNNIFMLPSGSPYNNSGDFVSIDVGSDTFRNNRYYDINGIHTSKAAEDSTGTYGNPNFTTAGTDFSLLDGSACIDAGSTPLGPRPYGFSANPAPQGTAHDCGAYER
jgi:hypothetical protein